MTLTTILILIISFFASLVRSTLGFGESLIAVPLFLLLLPLEVAVPLSVMLSIVIALVIVIQDHTKIHFQSAKWLVLYALPGIPLGLLILIYGNESFVKIALGLLIILYSLYSLFNKKIKIQGQENNRLWLFICGFLSGIFGGAYGLNGPPLVVYGNLKNWTAKHFRATLQAYFLPASFLGAIGYYAKGLITTEVNYYFLLSLTTTIPAIFLGRYLNHKLNDNSFFKYVYWSLIGIGLILILNSLK
ncbi:sulfite exporter TauE/SafE family protein (plasmid) [Chryseobacterium sp. SNU WT5]|uniref:sulfite exporter TauE/SafE family protein n=1 Tax=Chryseobacterium sp. SNU WT5 TaxID=2594269 RepID=UPI00117DF961|nr:sulfite exporter TauE/SafE family protein [Chryseobacterium sp. SNU WT5]QDP86763.1 sulfite exporter TauE/SafE family protein [Chryseobacterium sp. SNU WT5]